MKIYCEGLDLSEAVLKVIKATSSKNVNPILEGIKIVAEEDNLTLLATDGDLAIEKKIKADVRIDGETVVPGKFFCDFVKKLTNEKIELELNEKNQLKISYTDSQTYVQCLPVEEYPAIHTMETENYFSLESKNLKKLIEKTIFAVSPDDTRPILKGCLFEMVDNTITSVALDGYRLAKTSTEIIYSPGNKKLVIPARSLKEISNLLTDDETPISIYYDTNFILVQVEDTKIISKLLDGDYINYRQILPRSYQSIVTVNKSILENSLEQGSILARVSNDSSVKFSISEGVLNLKTNSVLGNWTDNLPISLEGEDLSITLNNNYLRDCLKVIEGDVVKMNFCSRISPCVITPEDENSLYLILPVKQI